MDISGKVFIVTGGASGLGEGTARMIAGHGGKVVIADLQADKLVYQGNLNYFGLDQFAWTGSDGIAFASTPVYTNINLHVSRWLDDKEGFSFRDQRVEKAFAQFVEDLETGLFKGPWVQLRRPFRPAPEGAPIPFEINIPFHPFRHQWRAWTRLSSRDGKPQATIITTGTGSGKTECFSFPVLDHCLEARKQGQKGIKAIVIITQGFADADDEQGRQLQQGGIIHNEQIPLYNVNHTVLDWNRVAAYLKRTNYPVQEPGGMRDIIARMPSKGMSLR